MSLRQVLHIAVFSSGFHRLIKIYIKYYVSPIIKTISYIIIVLDKILLRSWSYTSEMWFVSYFKLVCFALTL